MEDRPAPVESQNQVEASGASRSVVTVAHSQPATPQPATAQPATAQPATPQPDSPPPPVTTSEVSSNSAGELPSPLVVSATAAAPSDFTFSETSTSNGGEQAFTPLVPFELRFRDDAKDFFPRLAHDARGLVNCNNLAILGVALGGSLAIRSEFDDGVRNNTERHPDRWGEGTRVLGKFGEPQYQIPVLFGAYAFTLYTQDADQHDMMTSMISAYTLTGLSTVAVKGIANTRRPSNTWNGGQFGFPSYHTASSFAIAAVLDEYEGHEVGIPAYLVAGLIGWSRIDTRDHDLSDVVFGAALGYVIGKSVAGGALNNDSRVHIYPFTHPADGSPGLMLDASF